MFENLGGRRFGALVPDGEVPRRKQARRLHQNRGGKESGERAGQRVLRLGGVGPAR